MSENIIKESSHNERGKMIGRREEIESEGRGYRGNVVKEKEQVPEGWTYMVKEDP